MNFPSSSSTPSSEQAPDPTKVFMGTWRSLHSMSSFSADNPAWEAMREDVFADGQELLDKEGNSLLMFAVWSGQINIAQALHSMGCNPSIVNKRGFMVVQSLIRETAAYRKNRSPEYIASVIEQIPFKWSLLLPDNEPSSIAHAAGWSQHLMKMDASSIPPQSLGVILDFIAQPLNYRQLTALTNQVRAISNHGPESVVNSLAWKAQLARKKSNALIDSLSPEVREGILRQDKRSPLPKF